MAAPGRTVRVSGLPSDIEDVRLKDKLLIHFLRDGNGGGEIDRVSIVNGTPVSALITFDKSTVAQRVIHHRKHILDIDGRKCTLTATENSEGLDPNQVIISLSAVIDCSLLPGGERFLTNLCENHRDIHFNYIQTEESCTLSGTYSKVQAVLTHLLGHIGPSKSEENKQNVEKASRGGKTTQKQNAQDSQDPNRKLQNQKGEANSDKPADEKDSNTKTQPTSGGNSSKDTGRAAPMSGEDLSLIIDAVLFKYLQERCNKEWQKILKMYDVGVMGVTDRGLTTLFLEPSTAFGGSLEPEHLKLAKESISRFCQKYEAEIRQDQIAKNILRSKGELERIMESLKDRYPKLLVNEDDNNIEIIGSNSDVLEAKLFLLTVNDKEIISKQEKACLPKHTSKPVEKVSSLIGHPLVKTMWSEEEKIPQRPKKAKLAAQFKDPILASLGSRTADITIRTKLSPSGQSRSGPMLGVDVLSKPAQGSDKPLSGALAEKTDLDILFRNNSSLQTSISIPEQIDVRPKSLTPRSSSQSSLTGSADLPLVVSKSRLRRSNSFSAIPVEKAGIMEPISLDNSSNPTVRSRARTSSFSSSTNKEKQETHKAEITVPCWIWRYMNKVYRVRVEDLTSDVQMDVRRAKDCTKVILMLRGANKDKVTLCQNGLQELVNLLNYDFSVKRLRLSELGVSNTNDETLQACCSEVQSRYKKVFIYFSEDNMFLIGPEKLCSQVYSSLKDVFIGSLDQTDGQPKNTTPHNSIGKSPSSMQINGGRLLEYDSNTQGMFPSNADESHKKEEWQTTYMSDFCEKEATNGFVSLPTMQTTSIDDNSFLSFTASGNVRTERRNSIGLDNRALDVKRIDSVGEHQAKTEHSSEEFGSGGPVLLPCRCGANKMPTVNTMCGVTLCPICPEAVHANCPFCHEHTTHGVHGIMNSSKLPMTIPVTVGGVQTPSQCETRMQKSGSPGAASYTRPAN